jgi:hypothetical protein
LSWQRMVRSLLAWSSITPAMSASSDSTQLIPPPGTMPELQIQIVNGCSDTLSCFLHFRPSAITQLAASQDKSQPQSLTDFLTMLQEATCSISIDLPPAAGHVANSGRAAVCVAQYRQGCLSSPAALPSLAADSRWSWSWGKSRTTRTRRSREAGEIDSRQAAGLTMSQTGRIMSDTVTPPAAPAARSPSHNVLLNIFLW